MFTSRYADVFTGDERWRELPTPAGNTFEWDPRVDLRPQAPVLRGHVARARRRSPTSPTRGCWLMLGDSVTTDHISPAGSIKADSPAGTYLTEHGVARADFNSYGSRRGNHEVMIRGTFANIRLRNQLAPGTEGGVTRDFTQPDGPVADDLRRLDELPGRGHAAGDPGRQGIRLGLLARLGGQGHRAARRAGRDRRVLRAHPPLEPDRHGRAAAAVHGRASRRPASA